ncbi:MAG TPA: hypothetical protein VJI32_06200 [Candidatus Nanoarchaeia archaeon]|nr:hypothetical protein [Candidatus Nanoarchaeia archaeon]
MNIQRVKFKDIEKIPSLQLQKEFKKDFQGSSPTPFIGKFGYPYVNIGLLSPQISGDTSHYDAPKLWSQQNLPIGNIANLRYGLVNSRTQLNVKDMLKKSRFLEICQEVGMASKPVELEVNLKERPQLQLKSEKEIIPFGPQAEMQKAQITANPTVDSRVEKVVRDTDLKAAEAILSLYKKGFEDNFLTKLISVGNIGLETNRKLVPTRWSITAVDDTVGKKLIEEIKDFSIGEYQAYFGGGWGNYYLLLFFPQIWSYELFESYLEYKINPWSKEGNFYSTDYEGYEGRKEYAEETAGGYYAARIGILEKMKEMKRQHSCLALRFISSEYNMLLGVWVCREAARKSLQEKPLSFVSQELMLHYAKEIIKRKFGFEIDVLLKESRLLKEKKEQRRLGEF